jgi:putative transposase
MCMMRCGSCPLKPAVKTHLPASKPLGRLRTHTLRDVFNGIFYILRSGCPWRLLPHDFPLWPTVYHHFRIFRLRGVWHLVFKVLRTAERQRVARTPSPPRP